MNKTLASIVCVLAALNFSGCMKISKKNSQTTSDYSAQIPQPNPVSEPVVEVQPQSISSFNYEINSDEIKFQFPEEWPNQFFVEVTNRDQKLVLPINLDAASKTWEFKWPSKDRKFGLVFLNQLDKSLPSLKEIEVLPPLNISTTENIDLIETYGITPKFEKIVFEQLHLLKGAQIFLKTFSGEVIINNLYSEAGSIQTFPTNSKAEKDTQGHNGGNVEFKIISGQGRINLAALGQHGGDGSKGNPPDETLRGQKGSNGKRAEFGNQVTDYNSNSYIYPVVFPCLKDPTNSENGHKGKPGFQGHPGKNGGNSGLYSVEFAAPLVKLNFITKEGKGGKGGPGGDGGPGGFPGEIGDGAKTDLLIGKFNFSKERADADPFIGGSFNPACKPAARGEVGLQGDQGDPGIDGNDGVNEKN